MLDQLSAIGFVACVMVPVWLLILLASYHISGWRTLLRHYRLAGAFTGVVRRGRPLTVKTTWFRRFGRIGIEPSGVYVGVGAPFWFHPPLFIPADRIASLTDSEGYPAPSAVLRTHDAPDIPIILAAEDADLIRLTCLRQPESTTASGVATIPGSRHTDANFLKQIRRMILVSGAVFILLNAVALVVWHDDLVLLRNGVRTFADVQDVYQLPSNRDGGHPTWMLRYSFPDSDGHWLTGLTSFGFEEPPRELATIRIVYRTGFPADNHAERDLVATPGLTIPISSLSFLGICLFNVWRYQRIRRKQATPPPS